MFERLKDAARPANTIEPVGIKTPPVPRPEDKKPGEKAAAYTTEPDAIARTYYVEDAGKERRYYDDYQKKVLAIRASAEAISSKREDLNTIRAMLTMAEARGWAEIKVAGSAEFKRETWIEAQTRDIAAQGYKPSDMDRQEAARRRSERGHETPPAAPKPATNEVRQAAAPVPLVQPELQAPSARTVRDADATRSQSPPAPGNDATKLSAAVFVAEEQFVSQALKIARDPGPDDSKLDKLRTSFDAFEPADAKRISDRVADALLRQAGRTGDYTTLEATLPYLPGQSPANRQAMGNEAPPPSPANDRKTIKDASAELSPDGRIILAALSTTIDQQMDKLSVEAKIEMKAFVATELAKKEQAEGPVVLSAQQRALATAPDPAHQKDAATPPDPSRAIEAEAPRLSRGR